MDKSVLTWFLDLVRHLLIISGTVAVLCLSWTRVHWPLAIILAIPVYVVMFYLADFLTLPLYFLTPEHKVVSRALKAIEDGDFSTALRVMEAHEKRRAVELQDSPCTATTEGDGAWRPAGNGEMKECPKCTKVLPRKKFYDSALTTSYGRICADCKDLSKASRVLKREHMKEKRGKRGRHLGLAKKDLVIGSVPKRTRRRVS